MTRLTAQQAHKEELSNSVTHGIGLALSLPGSAILVVLAVFHGSAWHIVSCSLYGISLVFLYTASTLYHAARSPRLKRILKVLDHSSIYLLIAGTYTPFSLVNLHGAWGWTLFGLVWGLSLLGVLFKIFWVDDFKVASTTVYLVMGWLVVIAFKPVLALVPSGGVLWLLAGGVSYTAGTVFYTQRKLAYHHAVWHIFVMAGSICHYFAILFYVLPAKV